MKNFSKLFIALCAMASIATSSALYATEALVVLPQDGNPTCSSLINNALIMETRDTNPPAVGDEKELEFENGQKIAYTMGTTVDYGDTLAEFHLIDTDTTPNATPPFFPVAYDILKGSGPNGSKSFHFGDDGAVADSDQKGPGGTIKAVSFCYGIGKLIGEETTAPACNITGGTLDGVGVGCPTDTDIQHVIFSVKKGLNKGDPLVFSQCTCNVTATSCDSDALPGTIGACIADCPDPGGPGTPYPYTFGDETWGSELECLQANKLNETPNGRINIWNNGSGYCPGGMLGTSGCYKW